MSEHSYCQILGLTSSYTQQDLQQAYKSLAKRYHPDKIIPSSDPPHSQRNFIQIKDAYQGLKKINENKKCRQRLSKHTQFKNLFFNYSSESESDDSEMSTQYFNKRDLILNQQFQQIQKYLNNIKLIQDMRDKKMKQFSEGQYTKTGKQTIKNTNKRNSEKESWKLEQQILKQKIKKKINIFTIERS